MHVYRQTIQGRKTTDMENEYVVTNGIKNFFLGRTIRFLEDLRNIIIIYYNVIYDGVAVQW